LVGLVGVLDDTERDLLVHQYPGAIYKCHFVTPDQAVQWLWSVVGLRPANQELRARQFIWDARLFPESSAATMVAATDGHAVLPVGFRRGIFKVLTKLRPAPFPDSMPDSAALFFSDACAPYPAEPMSGWFGRDGSASDRREAMFQPVANWKPQDSCSLAYALGSSMNLDVSAFVSALADVNVSSIPGLSSEVISMSRDRINTLILPYVVRPCTHIAVVNESVVPSGAGSGTSDLVCDQNPAAPEDVVVALSDISVWVPTRVGMTELHIPRTDGLVHSMDPLDDFTSVVMDTISSRIHNGCIPEFGRYHALVNSSGVTVASDSAMAMVLETPTPDILHFGFQMHHVSMPIQVTFVGDATDELRQILGNVPRAVSRNVLQMVASDDGALGNSVNSIISVECSRMVGFDLRSWFDSDRVRLYLRWSNNQPPPMWASPIVLSWMDSDDVARAGFIHVHDSASVAIALADSEPELYLVFRHDPFDAADDVVKDPVPSGRGGGGRGRGRDRPRERDDDGSSKRSGRNRNYSLWFVIRGSGGQIRFE